MHWGKTLENKRLSLAFKPGIHGNNRSSGGFPYNHTEYELSQEKVLWDKIWIAAYNQSNQQRNGTPTSYANNHFLKKTRLLSDMLNSHTSSHSFVMVMVIASLFLFLTLAMTVAVVIFCRKKNSVFVFQKSEQEDEEGDYEMDDMDTNTDLEYTSDNEDDEGSPKKQYGQYLHVLNPSFRPPITCNGDQDQASPHPSPIYRPKRPLQDSRGAYQPIKMKPAIQGSSQNNGSVESFTGESASNKQYSGLFSKLSKRWNRNIEDTIRYSKHIPVIMVSDADSDSENMPKSQRKGRIVLNQKTEYENEIKGTISSTPQPCDTYDTQVSLAHGNSVSTGDHCNNGAVVQLAGITSPVETEYHNNCCDSDQNHSESPTNDTEYLQLITSSSNNSLSKAASKDINLSKIWHGCNRDKPSSYQSQVPQIDICISSSLHSLQSSPDKDCVSNIVRQNGCHSMPSTPGQSCTPALVLSSTVPSRKQWVTFDDIT